MRRRLWSFTCAFCFALFLAAGMVGVRSFWCFDEIGWEMPGAIVSVGSSHGRIFAGFGTNYPYSAKRGWHVGRPSSIRFEYEFAGIGLRNRIIAKTYHVRAVAFPIWLPMILAAAPAAVFVHRVTRHSAPTRSGFEINQPSLFSGRPST